MLGKDNEYFQWLLLLTVNKDHLNRGQIYYSNVDAFILKYYIEKNTNETQITIYSLKLMKPNLYVGSDKIYLSMLSSNDEGNVG